MWIGRTLLSLSIGAAIACNLSGSPAQAQGTCEWYAKTALEQQKVNVERKCGLKGLSWSSDRQAHMSWCATASPDEWKKQAQMRDQALTKCLAGK